MSDPQGCDPVDVLRERLRVLVADLVALAAKDTCRDSRLALAVHALRQALETLDRPAGMPNGVERVHVGRLASLITPIGEVATSPAAPVSAAAARRGVEATDPISCLTPMTPTPAGLPKDALQNRPQDPAPTVDFTRIRGIDPATAHRLVALGVGSFREIANWRAEDVRRISAMLGTDNRISQQNWIVHAAVLAAREDPGSGAQAPAPSRCAMNEVKAAGDLPALPAQFAPSQPPAVRERTEPATVPSLSGSELGTCAVDMLADGAGMVPVAQGPGPRASGEDLPHGGASPPRLSDDAYALDGEEAEVTILRRGSNAMQPSACRSGPERPLAHRAADPVGLGRREGFLQREPQVNRQPPHAPAPEADVVIRKLPTPAVGPADPTGSRART
jgi:predicted flap endonuclease-1-like 5' DNA nuclease